METTRGILSALVVVLLGCGSEPQLNPNLAGRWAGAATVTAPNFIHGETSLNWSDLTITTDGLAAVVSPVCPDGYRSATLHGSNGAVWGGRMECYPTPLGDCEAVTLTVTLVTAEVRPDGRVHVLIAGEADGCGADEAPVAISLLSPE